MSEIRSFVIWPRTIDQTCFMRGKILCVLWVSTSLKISPKINFCKNKGGDKDVGETRNGDKEDNCDLF